MLSMGDRDVIAMENFPYGHRRSADAVYRFGDRFVWVVDQVVVADYLDFGDLFLLGRDFYEEVGNIPYAHGLKKTRQGSFF
jgi:hypothetical protein